jgi:hypothetical protein
MGVSPREERVGTWNETADLGGIPGFSEEGAGFGFTAELPGHLAAARFEPSYGTVKLESALMMR